MSHAADPMAAELLSVSAAAYATCASNRFLEKFPDVITQFGENASADWKAHFRERIRELSAAILENEPALFVSRVRWSREAFTARKVSENLLRESLICLAETLDTELPAACRSVPAKFLGIAAESFESPENKASALDPSDAVSKLAMQYLLKILEGNSGDAIQLIVDSHTNGLSVEDSYLALMTAQNEVGRMWHEAEVNIAEEHLVTSTTRRAMAVLAFNVKGKPPNGRTVVAAAVKGNTHDIGVRAVSDFFELDGWRAICLGGDLPPSDIAQAVKFFDASLVLLSAAQSTQLNAIRETVNAVRSLDMKCKIMAGGAALSVAPELWQQLGADGYASSPAEAVVEGTQLVES